MHKKKLFYLGEDRDGLSLMIHIKKNCGIQLFLFKELIPACSNKVLDKKILSVFVKICPIPAKALEYYQITAKLDAFDISSLNTNAKINLM